MHSFRSQFMKWTGGYWNRLWDLVHRDEPGSGHWEEKFREVSARLPVPVFWLLGKTQSGKSSIVRALTGASAAEVGNGFQPCTRTARIYSFPNDEDPLIRFLDTRGLGEVDYSPTEDLQLFEKQAHLLIVVMKVMDHAQTPVLEALQTIHKQHPDWPVVVVQTSLHEGYSDRSANHIDPYPFTPQADSGTERWSDSVPSDLRRSLLHQRQTIRNLGISPNFVAVDFTLPEDGYLPVDYGLEALWDSIEEVVPLGLRGILTAENELHDQLRDACFREAQGVILSHALTAGGLALVPVPAVDLPGLLAVQARMCHKLASVYHQELNTRGVAELFGALGTGVFLRMGGRELLKLIPGAGSFVAAAYAAGMTYALGLTLSAYFSRVKDGAVPDAEEFREMYRKYSRIGEERMRDYFRRAPQKETPKP